MMPLVPETTTPAVPASQLIVTALVITTAPKAPGSRQLISPAAAVLEIAPAKVLQGAVRLHGLASSPTPDTHVLTACARAVPHPSKSIRAVTKKQLVKLRLSYHPLRLGNK